MNKSKFLKKSLAAILSVLLVVAMIPLSAAAAYEPTGVKPAIGAGFSGEVTGSGSTWEIAFNYNANNKPTITVETGNNTDKVYQIWQASTDGHNVGATTSPTLVGSAVLNTERDPKTDEPLPVKFKIVNGTTNEESDIYEVTWTMGAPAGAASVKSAKLGDTSYEPVIDEDDKTITFTVPFGFATNKTVTVEFNGCTTATASQTTAAFDNTKIGTNKLEAVPIKVSAVTEDALTDISYDIYVVEEEGLTSIKLGDYVGEFEKATTATTGQGKDRENGTINFYVPADFGPKDGKLELIPEFEVGSHYSNATVVNSTITTAAKITSGTKFDFKDATDVTLTLTSVAGQTRQYTLKFVSDKKDTTLTGITASKGTNAAAGSASYAVEGVIDGENISVIIPKEADITKVKFVFSGPKAISSDIPSVKVPTTGTADNFSTTGKTDGTNADDIDCTNPVRLVVTAADGKTQKYYTLTVTKADATEQNPTITAAKLVLNKGESNEYESAGVVDSSARTITFTVPHSTGNTDVQPGTKTEYTFAKSQSSFIDQTALATATISGGSEVSVSAGGGDALTYKVKYVRATPETGKTISNFVLTTAPNKNEIDYNNNKKYTVTASGNEFKVTVADDSATLNASFDLSTGAKMYLATDAKTPVTGPDKNGVLTALNFTDGTKYFVADELLATKIADNDSSVATYTQVKNNYGSHMVEYTFKVTEEASNAARLSNISAVDGNVTATIGGTNGDEITLTVPYSYRNEKEFFLNFTQSAGANVGIVNKSLADADVDADALFPVYSGGKVQWNATTEKLEALDSLMNGGDKTVTNVAFRVKPQGTDPETYLLQAGALNEAGSPSWSTLLTSSTDNTNDSKLAVVAEDDSTVKIYYVKEVKIADANTGAEITEAKVNGAAATINQTAETITANVPFGTNLGQIKLELTASKMATVLVNNAAYDADATYDCRKPIKVSVTSEDGGKTVVYTLTVNTGDQFSDVPADAWFAPYVKEANDLGIVMGVGNGLFQPYSNITRQDFALMTVRMLGVEVDNDATIAFTDADQVRADARGAVAYLSGEGIIGGYGDSTFKPNNYITRSEAAKILAVALELDVEGTPDFADNGSIAAWAQPYVAACQTAAIFTGDSANRFNGANNITRAETAKVMVESYKIK